MPTESGAIQGFGGAIEQWCGHKGDGGSSGIESGV